LGNTEVASRISSEDSIRIGVLNFSHKGSLGVSEKLGSYAADRLTNSLFIKKQYDVVDRSMVKSEMVRNKLSTEILNIEQINTLGKELNTDYLIVGKIVELTNQLEDIEGDKGWSLEISFRILDARTGEVKGVVRTQKSGKVEKRVLIGKIIDRMVEAVKIRR